MSYKDPEKRKAVDRARKRSKRRNPTVRYDEAQQKRRARAATKKPPTLVDAPVADLKLGDLDDPEISNDIVAEAFDRGFKVATRLWRRANPSRGAGGWANDLRATRSISEKKEREYNDQLHDDSEPDGNRKHRVPPEQEEEGVPGFLETNRSQPDRGGPFMIYVIQREDFPLPTGRTPGWNTVSRTTHPERREIRNRIRSEIRERIESLADIERRVRLRELRNNASTWSKIRELREEVGRLILLLDDELGMSLPEFRGDIDHMIDCWLIPSTSNGHRAS